MDSSSARKRTSARKAQWGGVVALVGGAAVLGVLGVSMALVSCMVAAGAVWGSILLATDPFVVRRVPNLRGAIVLSALVAALGLGLYAYNAEQVAGHAHAKEPAVSAP
jgi:hypothetical protein